MSDDLIIGGPAVTTVVTSMLRRQAQRFAVLRRELDDARARVVRVDRVVRDADLLRADAPYSAVLAEQQLDATTRSLDAAIARCDALISGLEAVAAGRERLESGLARFGQGLAAQLGYALGFAAPFLALFIAPGLLTAGSLTALTLLAMPEQLRTAFAAAGSAWLRQQRGVLTDPGFVELVRLSVMSADDFGSGLLRVPPSVVRMLGDEGFGVLGVDTSAAVTATLAGSVGLMRETRVRVRSAGAAETVTAPAGVQERIERIPTASEQVRVERFTASGAPDRFEVYIAGTADLAGTGREPWDMTSNVTAMAGAPSGSYRAVVEAMRSAGVTDSSPVVFTGYSQGGLVAAQLAASGDYATAGLVTVGAPAGQVAVPAAVPYLAIEHTDDLVPALGGTFASANPVLARRRFFDFAPPTDGPMLPAHELENYLATAGLVDASGDERVTSVLAAMDGGAATGTSQRYRAYRAE